MAVMALSLGEASGRSAWKTEDADLEIFGGEQAAGEESWRGSVDRVSRQVRSSRSFLTRGGWWLVPTRVQACKLIKGGVAAPTIYNAQSLSQM